MDSTENQTPSSIHVNPAVNEHHESAPLEPSEDNSRWKIVFSILSILSMLTIALPLSGMLWLSWQANSGVSGTEFIALLLFPVLLIGVMIAIINVIIAIIYLKKAPHTSTTKFLAIVFIIFSALYVCLPGVIILKNLPPWEVEVPASNTRELNSYE